MLKDPRASHLKNVLRDELAGLSALAARDFTQVGQTNALRDAMVGETDAFLNDIISNDKSALGLLTGDSTFANKTLADFYGLTFPAGTDTSKFMPLSAGRLGLGSQASVLTNTAGGSPTFTNPIKRGHWLADKLFCNSPPPPPPNIPPLPAQDTTNATIRQRVSAHVNQASCAACHNTMDNLGFGAESYDPFGRWRTQYSDGTAVDATGSFPDGTMFKDAKGLFADMGAQPQARSCVAQQLFKLALARALSPSDVCTANAVAGASVTETSHFSDLIASIAGSPLFTQQIGEAP
jgi:hypothetical protein